MNPQLPPLFVILVHYGDSAVTTYSLVALGQSTVPANAIFIIDQDPVPYILPSHLKATVIRLKDNNGYGSAANIGLGAVLSQAELSDLIVVMNNDVLVEPDTLALLRQQGVGSAALMGVATQENGRKLSGGGLWSIWTGRSTLQDVGDSRKPDYIHGSFLAATYNTWLRLKCMPEQYFLYWEDVLLAQQAHRKKIPIHLLSNISVRHDSHSDAPESSTKTYYLVRNGALFMEKETGWLIRKMWWLRNRLRLLWHKYRSGSDSVVYKALLDAKNGVTGRAQI